MGRDVLNDVQLAYNDFGQLKTDYQAHSGPVITGTPKVQYAYSEGESGANHSRLTDITYPNTRVLHHQYSGDNDNALSRVTYLSETNLSGIQYAKYDYLGLGQIVRADYHKDGANDPVLRYNLAFGTGDDPYDGLDQFGRVKDLRWTNYAGTANKVHIEHGYNRASNRKWRQDDVARGLSVYLDEYYNYDDVNQLTNVDRGELNGTHTGITGTPAWEEDFTLDPLGNWTGYVQTTAGTVTLDQDRLHNKANEIDNDDDHTNAPDDSITSSGGTPDWADPKQDAVGNMTIVPKPSSLTDGLTLKYDAWNRLVKVFEADGTTQVAGYQYDGLNRRIVKKTYDEGALSEIRHFYQSAQNQVLEERLAVVETGQIPDAANRQNVWGLRYLDDLVLRDDDSDNDGVAGEGSLGKTNSGLDRRLYALQDANWNVVAIADTSGAVQERNNYTAYGKPSFLTASFGSSSSSYSWDTLYTGRELDPETGLYNYRARYYSAELGRFISRDPIASDPNYYRYVGNGPIGATDPLGLWGPDVHRDLTTELARRAGLRHPEWYGRGANKPDIDYPPVSSFGKSILDICVSFLNPDAVDAAREKARADYNWNMVREWHFPADPDGWVRPGSQAARAKIANGIQRCDFKTFTEGLHVLQDSWSHQGMPYLDGIGHWRGAERGEDGYMVTHGFEWKWGFIPWNTTHVEYFYRYKLLEGLSAAESSSADDVSYWPADVRATGVATYLALLEWKEKCPSSCPPALHGDPTTTGVGPAEEMDKVEKFLNGKYQGENKVKTTIPPLAK